MAESSAMDLIGALDLIGTLVLLFMIAIGWGAMYIMYQEYQHSKQCAEDLGVEFDPLDWGSQARYRHIDDTHYNCCWKAEPYLGEDGYYIKEKCKGFIRND